jgi:uncharacterized protein DUF5666
MTEPHQQPEQVIASPVGGDIDQELTQAKRGVGKVTIGLGVAVLVVAAFFGGIWVHSATASSTPAPAAQGARPNGGTGRGVPPSGVPGAGGGAGGFRGGTVGTIDHIDGTTVYVKMQNGTVVKVTTTDTTKVEVSQPGKLTDLKPGATVAVQGQRAEDSSVAAQTITTQLTGQ